MKYSNVARYLEGINQQTLGDGLYNWCRRLQQCQCRRCCKVSKCLHHCRHQKCCKVTKVSCKVINIPVIWIYKVKCGQFFVCLRHVAASLFFKAILPLKFPSTNKVKMFQVFVSCSLLDTPVHERNEEWEDSNPSLLRGKQWWTPQYNGAPLWALNMCLVIFIEIGKVQAIQRGN